MKITLLILVLFIVLSCLTAVTLNFDGVIRTRGAIYNDANDSTRGHIDNRLRLGINTEIAPDLKFQTRLQFGNVTWGDSNTGGGSNSAVKISGYELYLDYRIDNLAANVRFGQQHWADPMKLIIDGSFSGIMLTFEDIIGLKTEMGFIKGLEADSFDKENNYFLINLCKAGKDKFGLLGSLYHKGNTEDNSLTLMPYVDLNITPVQIKATAFLGAHHNSPEDDELGYGTAIKAKADLGVLNLGADVLYSSENGIATIFPYYMNGLYIYGIGLYNDSVKLYWDTPYSNKPDAALSAVGSISIPLMSNCNFFGAAGYLLDKGIEVNAGIARDVIPKKMKIVGYAAAGKHEVTKVTNYLAGTSVIVTF